MNQIFKRMTSILMAFCVIVTLNTSALAGELKTSFDDVSEVSPYYEAVQYFANEGVICGMKDGFIHPETKITLDDWSGILARLHRLSGTETSAYTISPDCLQCSASNTTLPEIIYSSIWKFAGIKTYTAHEYSYASELDAGTTAMLVTGLIDREAVGRTSISRGEALRLLYEVVIKKTVTEASPDLIAFFDVSTDCEEPEETEALLRKLLKAYPNNQLALLLAYGYRFEIWDDLSSLPVEHSDTLLGLEDDGQHIIYLEKDAVSEWALHEVGHAVETRNCSYSKSSALNKAERDAGMELLGKYAGVNKAEFIAEAASYFMKNQDNEAAMQDMKEKMPQTYEHFAKLVSAEPFLYEKYFLDVVNPVIGSE